MAVIAAQTIDWASPGTMPQGQAVSIPLSSLYVTPAQMVNVVAAPEPYGAIAPAPPTPSTFSFG